jgi:hypothetical protein
MFLCYKERPFRGRRVPHGNDFAVFAGDSPFITVVKEFLHSISCFTARPLDVRVLPNVAAAYVT